MKKLITTLAFVFVTLMVTAQVEHYRASSLVTIVYDDKGEVLSQQSRDINVLITYDLENWTLTLQFEKPIVYYISRIVKTTNEIDKDGDRLVIKELDSRDKFNNKTPIWIYDWPALSNRNFFIYESNKLFGFECVLI